ncbi:MAG: transposase [bacterium]|nr:transposase [bacterium]
MFWPVNSYYFITAKTFLGYKLFDSSAKKDLVFQQIKKAVEKLNVKIYSYSIAQNHYHCLIFLNSYSKHEKFKQLVNGGSSYLYHEIYGQTETGGKMWLDCKTLVIYNQTALFKVIGYIDGNLLKHGEVKNFDDLYDNKYSSFKQHADKYGRGTMQGVIDQVIYTEEDDGGSMDLKTFNSG